MPDALPSSDTPPAPKSTADAGAYIVRRVGADEARDRAAPLAAQLAAVLLDCVRGGASVSFMADLDAVRADAFWRGVLAGAADGRRALVIAEEAATGEVVGTAQLVLDLPDNQPHRADVAKMLVHRRARRHGLAARLLQAIESEAVVERRDLLVLDTVTGGDAERLYARAGWQRVGEIPRYALMPDGTPCSTTIFRKDLPA